MKLSEKGKNKKILKIDVESASQSVVCLFVCFLSWSFSPQLSKKSTWQNCPCPHLLYSDTNLQITLQITYKHTVDTETHFNETFEKTHWRKVKQIILTSDWDTSSQTHRLHYIRDTSFQRRNTCG